MKKLKKLLRPNLYKRTAFYLVGEIILVPVSVFLAFAARFEGHIPDEYVPVAFGAAAFATIIVLALNALSGFYRMKWGAFGIRDAIYGAGVISFIAILMLFASLTGALPRSLPLIWPPIAFLVFLLFRGGKVIASCVYNRLSRLKRPPCVLVIPSDGRHNLIDFLCSSQLIPYRVAGIVDPNPHNSGSTIHGIKVLGTPEHIRQAVKKVNARCVVVVETNPPQFQLGDLWEDLKELDVEVRLISSRGGNNIRQIGASDLIKREPVKVNLESIGRFINGKRVMITGAGGSIGSELARRVAEFGPERLILFERDETALFRINEEISERTPCAEPFLGDITSEDDLDEAFSRHRPHLVFHAAAYKHVPMMEAYPSRAVINNVWGTYLTASKAIEHGADAFVNISTDKAVEPESVMGATKRIGEMVVRALSGSRTRMCSVRFGNVLGSRGSVLELFENRIAERKPIFVTHRDMERYFMLVNEAVLLVLEAAAQPEEGLYVLNMGKRVNIYEMAESLIRMSGLTPGKDIRIIVTGKRPGEKIVEELFWPHETPVPLVEERFYMINADLPVSPKALLDRVLQLVNAVKENRYDGDLRDKILEIAWMGAKTKEKKWLGVS